MKNIKAFFFDFDGVLLNSAQDIASSVNVALTWFKHASLPNEQIISFVGCGARNLILRSLSASTNKTNFSDTYIDSVFSWYVNYYQNHPVNFSTLYPNVENLLFTLNKKSYPIALISNKPLCVSEKILNYFDIKKYFSVIVGPELIEKIKPAPDGIFYAIKKINENVSQKIDPQNILMVGDSDVDIIAAFSAGIKACAITNGYGNKEKLLAQNANYTCQLASDILKFI